MRYLFLFFCVCFANDDPPFDLRSIFCGAELTRSERGTPLFSAHDRERFIFNQPYNREWLDAATTINAFQLALARDGWTSNINPYRLLKQTIDVDRRPITRNPPREFHAQSVDLAHLLGETLVPSGNFTLRTKRLSGLHPLTLRPDIEAVETFLIKDLADEGNGAKFMSGLNQTGTGEYGQTSFLIVGQDGPFIRALNPEAQSLRPITLTASMVTRAGHPHLRLTYETALGERQFLVMSVTSLSLHPPEEPVRHFGPKAWHVKLAQFDIEFSSDLGGYQLWRVSDGGFRLTHNHFRTEKFELVEALEDKGWYKVTIKNPLDRIALFLEMGQTPAQAYFERHLEIYARKGRKGGYVHQSYRDKNGLPYGWPGASKFNHRVGRIRESDIAITP